MTRRAGAAMSNLGMSYIDLGKHADALAMQEKALDFKRRAVPENHPDIGDEKFEVFSCALLFVRGWFFDLPRRLATEKSRLDVPSPWKARGCSSDGGKSTKHLSSCVARKPS